jgi:chromosome segregation ATPase
MDDVTGILNQISARLSSLENHFELHEGYFRGLETRVSSGFTRVDSRFEQIDSRFEQIDSRFEQIDSRFEHLDSRLESIDERLAAGINQITQRLDLMAGRQVDTQLRLASELVDHEKRIRTLEDKIADRRSDR